MRQSIRNRRYPVRLGEVGRGQHWETQNDLDVHVDLIRRQVHKSLDDPETRSLAVAIVSGAYDSLSDPRTGSPIPVVPFHGRYYRGALAWEDAAICKARDATCEINAIWNFAVLNLRYLADVVGQDTYPTLRGMLEQGGEDCDGWTILFTSLCGAAGYPGACSVISVDGRSWAHVYPQIKLRDRWIPLDATEAGKYPGWEFSSPAARRDFLLTPGGA